MTGNDWPWPAMAGYGWPWLAMTARALSRGSGEGSGLLHVCTIELIFWLLGEVFLLPPSLLNLAFAKLQVIVFPL